MGKELSKVHQEFIEDLKSKDRSQSTILAYGKDIEQLINFLRDLEKAELDVVSADDIKAFMAKLEKEGYTKKSISRKLNSTKTFFRFLEVQEYVTDNPAAIISHPKIEQKAPRVLDEMEYRSLRDVAQSDPRIYAIIELMLQTGVRIGEVRRMKISDIDFKNSEIRVAPYGKHRERKIPLNERATKALKGYFEVRPKAGEEDAVFVTKTGRPFLIRNIRASIGRIFERSGVKNAMVNDLRHTFIAHHLMRGASLTLISKIAGHKRLSTTEKYLKYLERPEEETDELIEL